MRSRLAAALDWGRQIQQEFVCEHATLTAAAIALFGLLSLFPLILLAISVASYALGNPIQAASQIERMIARFLVGEATATLTSTIEGVLRTRRLAGAIGLLGFLWAGSRVFTILMDAFNIAWDVERTRGFLKRNALAIGLVLLSLIFGTINFLVPLAIHFVVHHSQLIGRTLGVTINASLVWSFLSNLASYAATVALFFILYKVVPNRQVRWQSALIAAFCAGTLWEVVKYLFQLYLVNFSSYNEVYGALAGVIVLILWLYYSAMILLLGVVISSVHSQRVYGERGEYPEHRVSMERRAA